MLRAALEKVLRVAANMLRALAAIMAVPAALERLAAEPFDILFTDIVMPGSMDGIALAREARARHPHLRIVASAHRTHLGLRPEPYRHPRPARLPGQQALPEKRSGEGVGLVTTSSLIK